MTDDISKVNPYPTGSPEWRQFEKYLRNRRIEPAIIPAEVDVPTIDRDEAYQRDYIPLGRSGWEIQTKGKGSTYRICDKEGDRLAIPDVPYLHETLTRMAREVHADYTTLVRQLAEAKNYATRLAMSIYRNDYAKDAPNWEPLSDLCGVLSQIDNMASGLCRIDRAEQAESQLAEATRRLGEVEGLLREAVEHMKRGRAYYSEYHDFIERIAALTKESPK